MCFRLRGKGDFENLSAFLHIGVFLSYLSD